MHEVKTMWNGMMPPIPELSIPDVELLPICHVFFIYFF